MNRFGIALDHKWQNLGDIKTHGRELNFADKIVKTFFVERICEQKYLFSRNEFQQSIICTNEIVRFCGRKLFNVEILIFWHILQKDFQKIEINIFEQSHLNSENFCLQIHSGFITQNKTNFPFIVILTRVFLKGN